MTVLYLGNPQVAAQIFVVSFGSSLLKLCSLSFLITVTCEKMKAELKEIIKKLGALLLRYSKQMYY